MAENVLADREMFDLLCGKAAMGWALTMKEFEFFKAHEAEFDEFIERIRRPPDRAHD